MNKKERQKVFEKYGGKCAYCGVSLGNRWHCDHIEPVTRKTKLIFGNWYSKETGDVASEDNIKDALFHQLYEYKPFKRVPDGCDKPELDVIENMNPACASCNQYKHSMTLETFRQQIGLLVKRLNKSFTQYKISKRYGLVIEVDKPVVFYFETITSHTPPINK